MDDVLVSQMDKVVTGFLEHFEGQLFPGEAIPSSAGGDIVIGAPES